MAGLILLKVLAPMDAIVPTIASIVIGAGLGWLPEMLAGKLVRAEPAPAEPARAG